MLLSSPFEALRDFQESLEALYESDWLSSMPSGRGPFPPLNVFRKGDDFVIIAELPGVKKSDMQVQIKDNTIRISGTKSVVYPEEVSLHRAERSSGGFDRIVSIPVGIDAEKVKAEYRDGVLALFVPRAEHDKPKTIQVA
jgi:HSP20 family protein